MFRRHDAQIHGSFAWRFEGTPSLTRGTLAFGDALAQAFP